MPTPQDVQQQQAVQGAQQGVAPMDFDPQVIMQEIAQKDVQNQMKEQELMQREQGIIQAEQQIQAMNQQAQQAQSQEAQAAQAQAQEEASVPVAPLENPVTSPQQGMSAQQQQSPGGPDLSEQMLQQLQPGMKATVTKKYEMGPQGPIEVGRTENVSGGGGKQQQGAQAQ